MVESECSLKYELLPPRVLLVGDGQNPQVRLYIPEYGERARYVTLFHCWGDPTVEEKARFCTYKCNIDRRKAEIVWDDLPKSFQDAVTVTRELGIRFLWIDSMCNII